MSKELHALVTRGIEAGVIAKGGGGWLSFGEQKLGQGAEKAAETLAEKPDLVAAIEAALPPAVGGQSGDTSVGGGKPPASRSKRDTEKREFKVASALRYDGDLYEAGEPVELTRLQFLELKAGGAVEGDWPEKD